MSDVRINPLFAGSGMARLIRETAGRFMRTGIALRICNLVDADESSLKEGDVCGVRHAVFTEGAESRAAVETAAVFALAVLTLAPLMPSIESRRLGTS